MTGLRDAVLITRPLAEAEQVANQVARLGFRPVVAPLSEIRPLGTALPDSAAAVLLTSGNAAASVPTWAHVCPVFAVGDATAARARAAGCEDVRSAQGDARDLARLVHATLPPDANPLLLLCGRGQGSALAAMLQDAGRTVIRRPVYDVIAVSALPLVAVQALSAGHLRSALFFSASSARGFVRLLAQSGLRDTTRAIEACAIGPAAGVALTALPWREIRIARRPNQDEMLALLR